MAQSEAGLIDGSVAARSLPRGSSLIRVGWAVFAATSLAGAFAFALDLAAGTILPLLYVAVAVGVGLLGVLLTTRKPENRVSWVIAVAALWWAVAAFGNAYAVQVLVEHPHTLPGGIVAAWLDNWAWLPGITLFLGALLLLVPDGRLGSHRWWPIPATLVTGTLLSAAAISASAEFDIDGKRIANPLATDYVHLGVFAVVGVIAVIVGLIAALASFVVRYRRSAGDVRQQLRWVVASLAAALCVGVVGTLGWDVVPAAPVLPAVALLTMTAGIAVAVLKYRLYDLELVVNRALVYAALTAGVIAAYVVVVGLVGSYLSRRGDLLVSLAVTGIVAVCFQPARERVQRLVNRLMYGYRDDPYVTVAGLSRTLAGSLRPESVLPDAVDTIGRTLVLQHVAVYVDEDSGVAREAGSYGTSIGRDVLVVPLLHHETRVGELLLEPRPGERLRERDRRLIDDLAPQVAAAVHAVALSGELQAARQHLVELREEERRRIRRDLHDGLGPALAGLTFTIEAARNLATTDAGESDRLLASASEQVRGLVADVRGLIEGLRPPALDQHGLTASLRVLAARDVPATTAVRVDAPPSLPELPAAVEVAAFWIAQEALTNVRRHAHAGACAVRVSLENGAVRLEIEDDGVGLSGVRSGLGLHTMRERAAELRGTCTVGPGDSGGTLVSAVLPLYPGER